MTKMLEFSFTLSSLYSTSNVQIAYSSENANVEKYKDSASNVQGATLMSKHCFTDKAMVSTVDKRLSDAV